MQRQTLVPLKEFMAERPASGRGTRVLEVAGGTGRFATFLKARARARLPRPPAHAPPVPVEAARLRPLTWSWAEGTAVRCPPLVWPCVQGATSSARDAATNSDPNARCPCPGSLGTIMDEARLSQQRRGMLQRA